MKKSTLGKRKKGSKTKSYKSNKKVAISYNAGAPLRTGGFGNQMSGSEKKYITTAIDTVCGQSVGGAGTTAPIIQLINGVAQGSDYNNRVGRKTLNKSVFIRYAIRPVPFWKNGGSGYGDVGDKFVVPPSVVRMILVLDEQTNGVAPTVANVLDNTNNVITAQLNPDNRERFKILMDKELCLSGFTGEVISSTPLSFLTGWTGTSGNLPAVCGKKFKKLALPTIFNGGMTANVSAISTGSIYLMILPETVYSTNYLDNTADGEFDTKTQVGWVVNADIRVRFLDQ